ncbi:AAA family ATPase [Eggerthella sinensis]|uniref:Chromosome segregation protein SMC n=1 Tax=Eggerthella sinensis TaxID=242230 RepID=A0A3N0ITF3_9ACTN|nr:AAA family ATPase [Eggerthella sinensis]RDB63650.1 chromosome segregation protein SMC [Eggerthella sinensis]RNM40281.1 chromosome segregation protein SMC [Eggerthella sinensis]
MPVKINSLEVENVKRVKAVALEPAESGLTVIGGRNGQGKTSVLDSIAWALGGDRKRPSEAKREGSAVDPRLKVELSNGVVVERKGRNGSLKVTDPEGRKGGQQLLDSFVEALALDLPKFLAMSDKDKAKALLGIIGVGDELARLEAEEQALYNRRTGIGQMRDQKRGAADEMPAHPDAPSEPVSAMELIQAQQGILARNGENQRKRQAARDIEAARDNAKQEKSNALARVEELNRQIVAATAAANEADRKLDALETDLAAARKTAAELADESTAEIEASLAEIELTNAKVRDNQRRAEAQREADELDEQYRETTARIEELREAKMGLLEGADLPLAGLAVDNGLLSYEGRRWDCMSGSEQLRVATAIVRKLKPECGFVLVDKLEQMDPETLREFGAWAEAEGLQVIATRVSTGGECSIVIEDGYGGASQSELVNLGVPYAQNQAVLDAGIVEPAAPTFNFPKGA